MHNLAPIVITVYDRQKHLKQCIESLQGNDLAAESDLYIVSDAAVKQENVASIDSVRSYICSVDGFRKVFPVFRDQNFGAYRSADEAMKDVLEERGRFIFLEDDIRVSRHFLRYMNEGLDRYRDDPKILGICAYSLPFKMPSWYRKDIYLGRRLSPWGFGTWKEKWLSIDFSKRDRFSEAVADKKLTKDVLSVGADFLSLLKEDSIGRINANDVRACYHQIIHKMFCVFPARSLSSNAGFDGTGEHCGSTDRFDVEVDNRNEYSISWPPRLVESASIKRRFRNFQDGKRGFPIDTLVGLKRLAGRSLRVLGLRK